MIPILPALKAVAILLIVYILDRAIRILARRKPIRDWGALRPQIAFGILRGVVLGLGVLMLLDLAGISITPILASLGIGSLAVALALQDTLSNFFAGVAIAVDRPIRIGDYVRLESKDEGYVSEIGWRSTRIVTPTSNTVILPNSKLIGSVVVNYSMPDKDVIIPIECSVGADADVTRVERTALDIAKRLAPKTVQDFTPTVRFKNVNSATGRIELSVYIRAQDIDESEQNRHEFIREFYSAYKPPADS